MNLSLSDPQLAVGIEGIDDLMADLEQALALQAGGSLLPAGQAAGDEALVSLLPF